MERVKSHQNNRHYETEEQDGEEDPVEADSQPEFEADEIQEDINEYMSKLLHNNNDRVILNN